MMNKKFGDKVKINKIVKFDYKCPYDSYKGAEVFNKEFDSYKNKYKFICEEVLEGIVLRKTRKATGTYHPATNHSSFMDFDPEPAFLDIDFWHPVYEVAVAPRGVLVFVEIDDMEGLGE